MVKGCVQCETVVWNLKLHYDIHSLLYPELIIHRVRKRLYLFFFFFPLGAQYVESGVSCTDCY